MYEADAFLTYMSGSVPKLVANEADAVAPNALHVVRLQPLQLRASLSAPGLAALWQTSLTALSCELEGHSLGGGMLKLEPTEAERVAIALPGLEIAKLEELATDLDRLLRAGEAGEARELADGVILRCALGLSNMGSTCWQRDRTVSLRPRHASTEVFIDKYGKLLVTLLCVGRCWEKRTCAVLYCARPPHCDGAH